MEKKTKQVLSGTKWRTGMTDSSFRNFTFSFALHYFFGQCDEICLLGYTCYVKSKEKSNKRDDRLTDFLKSFVT